MVNRRSALKIGAATVAGVLAKLPVSGRNLPPAKAHIAFHRAVFDERFAECRGFAAELHSVGVLTSPIHGDVAKLWYEDLRAALSKRRAPVAGLTDRAALFCLEELARDVNMRVVFRVDHTIELDGLAQHVAAAEASIVSATRLLPKEPHFGRAMAERFSRLDPRELRDAAAQKRTGPFAPEDKTVLVSWVIA
jgi:hypothetical protein